MFSQIYSSPPKEKKNIITFAFLKINGRPFHYFLLNLIQTLRRPSLKIWNKEVYFDEIAKEKKTPTPKYIPPKQHLSATRLSELSLVVDTGGAYREEVDI